MDHDEQHLIQLSLDAQRGVQGIRKALDDLDRREILVSPIDLEETRARSENGVSTVLTNVAMLTTIAVCVGSYFFLSALDDAVDRAIRGRNE